MNFVAWLNSLDELLYELMSWLVFFPLTLWRTLTHPLKTMRYAEEQLLLDPANQYRGTVSPPIMLILAILVSQALALAIEGTSPLITRRTGISAIVSDNTTLLLLRIFLFGIFAVTAATWKVHRSQLTVDRDTLKPPFYAQCYAVAPFALLMGLAAVCMDHPIGLIRQAGVSLFVLVLLAFGIVQTRWLQVELGQSVLRSFVDASIIMSISVGSFLLVSVPFALS